MLTFIKKHNFAFQVMVLVVILWTIAFYNYLSQKELLLKQMQIDSDNIAHSFLSTITRFHDIKATMSLTKLVSDVSLGLEIFEFRYLDKNGVVLNSMFENEIGEKFARPSFMEQLAEPEKMGEFYFETRDYVPVMAISQPVLKNGELVGIIDLSVDVSESEYMHHTEHDFHLMHRKTDLRNLLSAVQASVLNSLEIFEAADLYAFLHAYVTSTKNILQVAIINDEGEVLVSSDELSIGKKLIAIGRVKPSSKLLEEEAQLVYRIITDKAPYESIGGRVMLLMDATPYVENERKLFLTAVATSLITILFAVAIVITMYRINIDRARKENIRLEGMVAERTKEIERLSKTDTLTQLWNRGGLEERMEIEFGRARRYAHELAFLVIDLDHFKKINDTYGHMAGDEVLRVVSARLKQALRKCDFVGRYGGEELVVLLPETPIQHVLFVAEKLCQVISSEAVVFEDSEIPVTASIGVSCLAQEHQEYQELFNQADEALYHAKETGRNRVCCYDDIGKA